VIGAVIGMVILAGAAWGYQQYQIKKAENEAA